MCLSSKFSFVGIQLFTVFIYNTSYFCRVDSNIPYIIIDFGTLNLLSLFSFGPSSQKFVNFVDIFQEPAFGFVDISLLIFYLFSPLKGMATHSSILAWRIPWTEEPGGLQSVG